MSDNEFKIMNNFYQLCYREFLIKIRQPRDIIFSILFFVMACLFFPLSLPASHTLFQQLAPGIVWFCLTLAMLLSMDQIWQQDYDNGLMTQWYLRQYSIVRIIQAKILVHWLITLVSVVLILPILAIAYGLNLYQTIIFLAALLAGSLIITYLTALAAVFSLSMQQKGAVVALILLPLVLPVIIWGSGVVGLAAQHIDAKPYLALLLAGSIVSVMLLPWPIATVIKMQISECE